MKFHGLVPISMYIRTMSFEVNRCKIWVNKGELRPGAVIPALLLLFRLGFQTYNCNILFPVIWECGKGLSCNKRKNKCRLALQSCSVVPGQVAVACFQLSCHSEWLSHHCSKTLSFATSVPLSSSSNNDYIIVITVDHTVVKDFVPS